MSIGREKLDGYRLAVDRMAAMLSRPGGREYQVREGAVTYAQGAAELDPDPDSDIDLDEQKPQP